MIKRFALAFVLGFALNVGLWVWWTRAYVDPDPYAGMMRVIVYLYLAPVLIACAGLVAFLASPLARRPDAGVSKLRAGGPVFVGFLLGAALGSFSVVEGGA